MREKPAILGGTRIFETKVPIVSPTLPAFVEIEKEIVDILESSRLTNFSRFSRELEAKTAQYLGVTYSLTLANGTTGLLLLEQVLKLQGEVIVPSFTFSATVHSLMWNGLTPVFVDIDPQTYNIDANLIEENISPATTAILAVHIFGVPCDISHLEDITRRQSLKLIFDAAHAFGSKYQGQYVGGFGEAEVFSLSVTKLLATGEGGLLTTNVPEVRDRVVVGRKYGDPGDYNCEFWGLNGKMTEFNAILGLKMLDKLEDHIQHRNELAALFRRELGRLPGIAFQEVEAGNRSTFKDFSILVDECEFGLGRDQLACALAEENVETRKYFYPPVHRMKAYRGFFEHYDGRLPNTDRIAGAILCLPIYSHMSTDLAQKICFAIERIHSHAKAIQALPQPASFKGRWQ